MDDILAKLFEHNNWANDQIVQACAKLSDAQLDAEPQSATEGTIRHTLTHLVSAQRNYLMTLTLPIEDRRTRLPDPAFSELPEIEHTSGQGLLALAKNTATLNQQIQTRDGYLVEPWVLMVQIINHATEHREQIKSMLTALGFTAPSIDGWDYGDFTKAMVPVAK